MHSYIPMSTYEHHDTKNWAAEGGFIEGFGKKWRDINGNSVSVEWSVVKCVFNFHPHQTLLDSDQGKENLSPLAIENSISHVFDLHKIMISGPVREISYVNNVSSINYSLDGTQVFVGRYDRKAVTCNIMIGTILCQSIYECCVYIISYSPNGSQITNFSTCWKILNPCFPVRMLYQKSRREYTYWMDGEAILWSK